MATKDKDRQQRARASDAKAMEALGKELAAGLLDGAYSSFTVSFSERRQKAEVIGGKNVTFSGISLRITYSGKRAPKVAGKAKTA